MCHESDQCCFLWHSGTKFRSTRSNSYCHCRRSLTIRASRLINLILRLLLLYLYSDYVISYNPSTLHTMYDGWCACTLHTFSYVDTSTLEEHCASTDNYMETGLGRIRAFVWIPQGITCRTYTVAVSVGYWLCTRRFITSACVYDSRRCVALIYSECGPACIIHHARFRSTSSQKWRLSCRMIHK